MYAYMAPPAPGPVDLLCKERPHLTPMGAIAPYQIIHCEQRTVDAEALVRFEHVRYSVPALHCGARVDVEALGGTIRIRCKDLILAEHPRSFIRDARVEDLAHVQERHDLSILSPPTPPSRRGPVLAFEQALEVEARPLSFYQEVI
jgi:hypothetical protein